MRDSLPLKVYAHWKGSQSEQTGPQTDSISSVNSNLEDKDDCSEPIDAVDDKLPGVYHVLRQSFLKSFKLMDKELKGHPTIDCFCSGSTAITLVKQVIQLFWLFSDLLIEINV